MSICMASEPLVTVIVPNFNCMPYLPAALESVWAQTFTDLEVIVVDDGSTDGSREWLTGQACLLKDLVLLKSHRTGPAAARNLAIAHARGRYIAFLDADDTWLPNKLNAQVTFHQANPAVSMSFTNYEQVNALGKPLGDGFSCWQYFLKHNAIGDSFSLLNDAFVALFRDNPVGTSTVMATKESLRKAEGFDTALPSAEDIDLWLKLALQGEVAVSSNINTHYLVRPGSESARFDDRMLALNMINTRYLSHVKQTDPRAINHFNARLASAVAQWHRSQRQFFSAFLRHCMAFFHMPSKQHLKALLVDLSNLIPR
ncbi:glycosyltransferase family 2 protein [Alteromonas sediminis]|uniref:Glycosyltransferase family 2 protein n=1 Tax=Alteromonas sediminis TaxID=2259342 RepID=A0A3N5Y3P6_9ALTE|nr:glycosyltransferase family A protein [Alteromonas sediminis]RPJ68582.1 glycosyltransferase family 2 protein [Alteromonas sediminis]